MLVIGVSKMNKHWMKGFFGIAILSILVLSGCAAVTPEKFKKLDEFITDIEVDEVENGLIMTFKTKGGGSFAISIPDKEGCSVSFGNKINQISCGGEEVAVEVGEVAIEVE